MSERKITLECSAFLDSPQAAALEGVPSEIRRAVAERFLSCCYDELGKAPRLLDGQDMHEVVGHRLPAHFGRKDPAAAHALEVLRAYLAFLEESAVVSQAYELRRALETTADEFTESVRTGHAAHHAPHRPARPFVHQAEKTGRNDPCPCGSGKKFKKCCADLAR